MKCKCCNGEGVHEVMGYDCHIENDVDAFVKCASCDDNGQIEP